jgi:hypothetical protein
MSSLSHEVKFPDGNPSAFQRLAIDLISSVLKRNGVSFDHFLLNIGAKRGFWTNILIDGMEYIIAVYPDEVNLMSEGHLYECELRSEFKTREILAASFASRLEYFLTNRRWIPPKEYCHDTE